MKFNVRNRYAKTILLLLCIVTALMFFLLDKMKTFGNYNTTILPPKFGNKELIALPQTNYRQTQTYKDINSTTQKTRKDDIHKYCKETGVSESSANSSVQLIHDNKFNLSYLDIPKIGSTFITQVFSVLKYGPSYAKSIFSMPRNAVHKKLKVQRKRFLFDIKLDKLVTIVPVRNPYSRLFAAFVDKVFLPNSYYLISNIIYYKQRHTSRNIAKLTQSGLSNSSELSVTFLDFLKYALGPRAKISIQFDHYEPCFPRLKLLICYLNNYVVVKQETFETDMKSVLQMVGVNKKRHKTYNIIIKSLHESRVEDSIPGIIKVTFAHAQKRAKIWTGLIVAERLWQSFQIQGYVSKHVPFPKNNFNPDLTYSNVSFISNVFLREMKKAKLSRTESMKQRKEALLSAYKGVPENVMRRIQDIYNCDFKAFGYNKTLA